MLTLPSRVLALGPRLAKGADPWPFSPESHLQSGCGLPPNCASQGGESFGKGLLLCSCPEEGLSGPA